MARYDAFVLRVWRSGAGDDAQWAGRVEHLPDGVTLRFGSLASLLDYLCTELAIESDARPTTPIDSRPANEKKGVRDREQHSR